MLRSVVPRAAVAFPCKQARSGGVSRRFGPSRALREFRARGNLCIRCDAWAGNREPVGVDAGPFSDLDLLSFKDKLTTKVPTEVPDWSAVFEDPHLPLMLDIGSGSGRFCLKAAKRGVGATNVLGMEIRTPLVQRCLEWTQLLGLRNVHFMVANANVNLERVLASYPAKCTYVSIQCPDPHFKRKHKKRRVVQPDLVRQLMALLPHGAKIFLQSDVLEVAFDMCKQFETHGGDCIAPSYEHAEALQGSSGGVEPSAHAARASCVNEDGETEYLGISWLHSNPNGIPTEREHNVLSQGLPMYRAMYVVKKNDQV
eukprot:jgi/Mesvir1/550/Mv11403-RA.2